jgi:hypothetical protein
MGQGTNTTVGSGASAGGGTGGPGTLATLLPGYEPPQSDLATAYLSNLKGGIIDMPTFQEMYQSYSDVANQQAQRAGASITEAFGSQGARYGSDLLRAQSQNQQDLASQLRSAASQFQLGLRGQQANEINSALQYQTGRDVLGMSYLWQDYLRRTSPPPLLGAAASQPGQAPPPAGV